MNEIKPIKRSPELQPLSREHHEGLLFAWKIRQGLKNGTSIERLSDFTGWYWKNHIRPHFYQEEKILMPLLITNSPLAIRMNEEHDQIRELVIDIDKEPSRQDFIWLSDLIERHIRFEERELFQYLEENLLEEELSAVHEQLEKHPVSCGEWRDEFWTKK